jgi:hypothetical protein
MHHPTRTCNVPKSGNHYLLRDDLLRVRWAGFDPGRPASYGRTVVHLNVSSGQVALV